MNLFIDTTDFNSVTFFLLPNSSPSTGEARRGLKRKSYKIDPHKSHETLEKLEKFLKSCKIQVTSDKIRKIYVNKGPGSFTGTRVGAAHALALSLAWKVPLKALGKEQFEKEIRLAAK